MKLAVLLLAGATMLAQNVFAESCPVIVGKLTSSAIAGSRFKNSLNVKFDNRSFTLMLMGDSKPGKSEIGVVEQGSGHVVGFVAQTGNFLAFDATSVSRLALATETNQGVRIKLYRRWDAVEITRAEETHGITSKIKNIDIIKLPRGDFERSPFILVGSKQSGEMEIINVLTGEHLGFNIYTAQADKIGDQRVKKSIAMNQTSVFRQFNLNDSVIEIHAMKPNNLTLAKIFTIEL